MNLLNDLYATAFPEVILIGAASLLFLLGISTKAFARKLAPVIALAALLVVLLLQMTGVNHGSIASDRAGNFRVSDFGNYIKMLSAGIGALFVLLSWPTDSEATGNNALQFGHEAGEFFALLLLSVAGIFVVAGANDLILLFLGIELASIPTYVMVSISRPTPVAQEAGVKYFFLGAMAAAILLFGLAFLYGTTGSTNFTEILTSLRPADGSADTAAFIARLSTWQILAAVMVIGGLAFKMAAVPLHFYAGDVYQGAATPVTAFLSYVPKTAGFVALIKILYVISGGTWGIPFDITKLLWILAVLTMTVGNVLGLMQVNIKRVLAYSSVAHTGYMLVAITTICYATGNQEVQKSALHGVLFYLAAYGVMNAAAFGVLILLPAKATPVTPATSAETYEDLAGQGRLNLGLGLAMAVACFSLIGLPLTVGFFGKVYLIQPALMLAGGSKLMLWLVIITMVNAAISAGYYLRIVGTMFLASPGSTLAEAGATVDTTGLQPVAPKPVRMSIPIVLGVGLSAVGTLILGTILPATNMLDGELLGAVNLDEGFRYAPPAPTPPPMDSFSLSVEGAVPNISSGSLHPISTSAR